MAKASQKAVAKGAERITRKPVRKRPEAAVPRTAKGKTKSGAEKPAYHAPALEKGLDILELLSTLSAPVTPSQIAQRLGRSLQEVYRVVVALERRGYLVRPPGEEALVLSTQLFGLATLFPPFRRVVDAAQPIMNALALESSQAVHMVVLDGLNQRIIAQVDSPAAIAVRLRVGAARPAHRASSGRPLVAVQPPAGQGWILREAASSNTPEQVASARARVADIRARGYEMIEGEMLKSVTDLSFPILNTAGVAIAVMTMPFLTTASVTVPLEDDAVMLHRAVSRITGLMGGEQGELVLPLGTIARR